MVKKAVNKGAWTPKEDRKLMDYVSVHGDRRWRTLPAKAGLNRSGKSCRLRWLNYLRPGIKRGNISEDEEDLIIRLHNLIGNRWSLIAGRLPGRTDNEIKNYWNTHLNKKSMTINDLNSKLNLRLEGGTVSKSATSPMSPPQIGVPISPTLLTFSSETNQTPEALLLPDTRNPSPTTACVLTNDVEFTLNLDTCLSPSHLWFQPLFNDEHLYRSDYEDVCIAPTNLMDHAFKDFSLYLR